MNTKFVGIKEFRKDIAKYAKSARTTRYVVMSHKKPLFEIKAFEESETLDSFLASVLRAKEDVKKGRVFTHDEIVKMLG